MGNIGRRKSAFLKMDLTTWLSIATALVTLAMPALSSSPRVVCYYTNWSVYRPGTAKFNPQNINPYLCTHLVYAFGGFTKDNTLKPFDKYQDIEKGGYAKFNGLKTYNKDLKTLLAIGGWNEGSSRFSPMVASKERRREFVRNAIKFLRQNLFDGLDLDWEYPAFRDGGKAKDRENYSKLVKELRGEFEKESQKSGKPRLLLTMAVPAGIEYIQKGFDVKTLTRYLDWMNLLTYDYHSAFEPAVNHHAPLYPLEEPNEYSVDDELNIDYTIKFYLENGAEPDKLVLGIPTYGRSYTLFNADAVDLGSPADGPGEQGDATREKGYLAYYEICEALMPKIKKRAIASDEDSEEEDSAKEDSSEEVEEEHWMVMYPYPNAMGPVAYKGNQWVGYDDAEIVKKKAHYVVENGLGGIMFWSIDNDDFRGVCSGKPYPLIEAAKEAYLSKLGSSKNAVASRTKERSKPSRSENRRRTRPSPATTTTTTTTTRKPAKSHKRKTTSSTVSTTPSWNVITPEPPTTPDPGSDFKCTDEGFFPHPRDCKKYFWCLDSGPSDLGIVAHAFTCPSGLYFNKAADSCDFARNVLCKKTTPTTKAPTKPTTTTTAATTTTTTTTRRPIRLTSRSSLLFRTTTTTTTTPEPEISEEVKDEEDGKDDAIDVDAEDPKVIKELIDLIKKVGGVEQLEKQLKLSEFPEPEVEGAVSTTPAAFNTKLYQKVLEKARGKNKFGGNSITGSGVQNSRRGPQNEGIEPTSDKDRLLRRDRPQYVTINRAKSSTTSEPSESDEDETESEELQETVKDEREEEPVARIGTTSKPLQYVNIRRSRPTTAGTTEIPDESRNALFERESSESVERPTRVGGGGGRGEGGEGSAGDSSRRTRPEAPEYVTLRRGRPTTETTTLPYHGSEDVQESKEVILEREITSQSPSPQYNSIVRTRSTTLAPPEEPTNPDPTTILSVQISSLLNAPNSEKNESQGTDITTAQTLEASEPETTTTSITVITTTTPPATTTTTTTPAPPSPTTRRNLLRRRGSTTPTSPTTTTPVITTQVSTRNYSFIRRRRPLSQPNEISAESNELDDNIRKIRSTTPDSREVNKFRSFGNKRQVKRFRSTSQIPRSEDSIPAEASLEAENDFNPESNQALSLTAINVNSSEVIENEKVRGFHERILGRVVTTIAEDSEVSAATIDERRPNILPRGRTRFSAITTESIAKTVATVAPTTQKRQTFSRFTPRPFARNIVKTNNVENKNNDNDSINPIGVRPRLPFGRARSAFSTLAPSLQARKIPFTFRQSTAQTLGTSQNIDDDIDNKNDDITLSESAIAEKEHEEILEDLDLFATKSTPERKITPTVESQTDTSGKRKFKIIRRRPTSTQKPDTTAAPIVETTTPTLTRIRKIIRKKIKPVEEESPIDTKNVGLINAGFKDAPKDIINYGDKTRQTTSFVIPTQEIKTTTEYDEVDIEPITELLKETVFTPEVLSEKEGINQHQSDSKNDSNVDDKPEVVVENEDKSLDISENKEQAVNNATQESLDVKTTSDKQSLDTENIPLSEGKANDLGEKGTKIAEVDRSSENKPIAKLEITTLSDIITDTTTTSTTSTTQLTSPSPKSRSPYKPLKKLLTSTTESISSSSRTFSRKYNPGAYTSPATVEKPNLFKRPSTKRPLFTRTFTRRTFTTARTTPKLQYEDEEEYSDEEILDEEPESPYEFVPPNKLFTRKPDSEEYGDNEGEEEEEEIREDSEEIPEEENYGQDQSPQFKLTSKKPLLKPKLVNSNAFRTSTSATQILRRPVGPTQNKTIIYNRFGANKSVANTKNRVQNVPIGYNKPKLPQDAIFKNSTNLKSTDLKVVTTTTSSASNNEYTTTESDDYLSMPETTTFVSSDNASSASFTNVIDSETTTDIMEVNNSTDDYLEYTTNQPTTQDEFTKPTEIDIIIEPSKEPQTTKASENIPETTTESLAKTTTIIPSVAPIVKTQFNKLFSISRVVEVHSKSEKHHLNKNNKTTLIEEGKIIVEKKPTVDKIGEVSRFSLIKIFEDEIPIYLTKLGHVYPVDNPPDNPIRIDEARNARALVDFSDIPKENLIASESMNEAYRHVNKVYGKSKPLDKGQVEHILGDDFLSYINEEKKTDKLQNNEQENLEWQFIPAAFENDKQINTAKTFEIVTPRMSTDPSTLSLESLFKTENPILAKKISDSTQKAPFVVYSAPVASNNEEANIVKLKVLKPETGRSVVTFAKGQEFKSDPIDEETTIKYPISISILEQTFPSTHPMTDIFTSVPLSTSTASVATTTNTTSTKTENIKTSPIMEFLSTIQTTLETETVQKTESSSAPTVPTELMTTETVTEQSTTVKSSPLDEKRSKFPFPRRPIIKPANFTRFNPTISIPRSAKKINVTFAPKGIQKTNKTTSFSPNKSRFSGNRAQNVPVDIRKKSTTKTTRSFTTESPRSTTERKVFIKTLRPRPAFIPRRYTTVPTTLRDV